MRYKHEGVARKLPVIDKLGLGSSPKPGEADQALRVTAIVSAIPSEENGSGAGQLPVVPKVG